MYAPTKLSRLQVEATSRGLMLVLPNDNELSLDLDLEKNPDFRVDQEILEILETNEIGIKGQLETISQNGGRHVYIRMDTTLSAPVRYALAACLGSDPTREALAALYTSEYGEDVYTYCMFEKPDEFLRFIDWRRSFDPTGDLEIPF